MVDVVVFSVVTGQMLERIPRQLVSAMVVDSFDSGHCEEPHALTCCHEGALVRNGCTERIKKEAFKGVVVKGTECIRDVETVVARMEGG